MVKQGRDLLIVIIVASAATVLAISGLNNLAFGLLFGLPLALLLPGYAVVAASAPSAAIGSVERLVFSVGTSIAICILGGVALHATPWGLRPAPWAILLGSLTLCSSVIALIRRRSISMVVLATTTKPRVRLKDVAIWGLAVFIVTAAFTMAMISAARPAAEGFTQLWALPTGERVQIGVQNLEGHEMQYAIMLVANDRVINRWAPVVIAQGARWETVALLPPHQISPVLEVRLYRMDELQGVYRQVILR